MRQAPTSLAQLIFAEGVRGIYKVQFMLSIRTLNQFAKPCPLCLRGGSEIEDDGDALRQETANVWRERVLQSLITVHEGRDVGDLVRKQGIQ